MAPVSPGEQRASTHARRAPRDGTVTRRDRSRDTVATMNLLPSTMPALLITGLAATAPPPDSLAEEPVAPPPLLAWPVEEHRQISMYIREVYQDRAGDMWFGTNGDGVARWDGDALTFLTTDRARLRRPSCSQCRCCCCARRLLLWRRTSMRSCSG